MQHNIQLLFIKPNGFCAGVERAIEMLDKALEKFGTPIYVRNHIVHSNRIVSDFEKKGVIFVKSISEIPQYANTLLSAHGSSTKVYQEAKEKNLNIIDAVCPLVKKVHTLAINYHNKGYQIIFIGHKNHPEAEGVMGLFKDGIYLVSSVADIQNLTLNTEQPVTYITQTTLSINDTKEIVATIKNRFPQVISKDDNNICYATQNRQDAIKQVINQVDVLLVIGSKHSSNSNRLQEIGTLYHKPSFLIDNPDEIPWSTINQFSKIALSAGASAPFVLINDIITALKTKYHVTIQETTLIEENVYFHLPKILRN